MTVSSRVITFLGKEAEEESDGGPIQPTAPSGNVNTGGGGSGGNNEGGGSGSNEGGNQGGGNTGNDPIIYDP